MCCRDDEFPAELTKARAGSLEKVMSTPYDALKDLLGKLEPFLGTLAQHPEVRAEIIEFLENDLQGWIATFELDESMASSVFERVWSRSE